MSEEKMIPRRSLLSFSEYMEIKLRENDWKGGWEGKSTIWMFKHLLEEAGELAEALTEGSPEEIIREAADVGNFAMMIAEKMERRIKDENIALERTARESLS